MNTSILRSLFCGAILAAFAIGTSLKADDTSTSDGSASDTAKPHHCHHHHCCKDKDKDADAGKSDSSGDSQ
jgi:hypothetical protein